jgi:hypothetical protein
MGWLTVSISCGGREPGSETGNRHCSEQALQNAAIPPRQLHTYPGARLPRRSPRRAGGRDALLGMILENAMVAKEANLYYGILQS